MSLTRRQAKDFITGLYCTEPDYQAVQDACKDTICEKETFRIAILDMYWGSFHDFQELKEHIDLDAGQLYALVKSNEEKDSNSLIFYQICELILLILMCCSLIIIILDFILGGSK